MNNDLNNQNMGQGGYNPNPVNNGMNNQNMGQAGYNPNPVNIGMNNQNMGQGGYNPNPVNIGMNSSSNQKNKKTIDKKIIKNIAIGIGAFIIGFLIVKLLLGGSGSKKISRVSKYLPDNKYDVICEKKDTYDESLDVIVVIGLEKNKAKEDIKVNMVYIFSSKNGKALEAGSEKDKYIEENMKSIKADKYEYIDGKIVLSKFILDTSGSVDDLKNNLISQGCSCK